MADAPDLVHPVPGREPLVAQDACVVALVLQVARRHPARLPGRPDVVVHLVGDVDLRHEAGPLRRRREEHVPAVLHDDGQPAAGGTVVGQDPVEGRLAVPPGVQPRRVVEAAAHPRAGGVPVEVGAGGGPAPPLQHAARDGGEVHDVPVAVVERGVSALVVVAPTLVPVIFLRLARPPSY